MVGNVATIRELPSSEPRYSEPPVRRRSWLALLLVAVVASAARTLAMSHRMKASTAIKP